MVNTELKKYSLSLLKLFSSSSIALSMLTILAISTMFAISGCASSSSNQNNSLPKIGERYNAPVSKSIAREIDIAEVGRLNLKLASAYYSAGQYQTANESAQIAVEALPGNVGALGLAALIQLELRNNTKAQEYFNKALKIAPKDADLNHNYGVYLCRADVKNNPSLAMDHFNAALAVEGYTKPGSTLSAAGDCLVRLGRDDEASQYYSGALRFEPANRFALLGLAETKFRAGMDKEALEFTARFARVAHATPELLWLQVRIARKMGMHQDEKIYASDMRRTFPDAPQTRLIDEEKAKPPSSTN